MTEVFAEWFWEGTSRESKSGYVGIQGRVGCLGSAEEGVVDWAKVGVTGKRRRVEGDGVCGFDDKTVGWLIGGMVGAATAVNMPKG